MANKPMLSVERELLHCKCGNAAEHFKFEGANFYGCRACGKAYGKAEEWNASTVPAALPDRKSAVETFSTYGLGECAGWNACLDAVSETVRLEQAATESWRDAAMKLHDQLAEFKAAQHQGEPVAEIVEFGKGLKEVSWLKGRMPKIGTKLYAEQPAPVAESTHETREHIDADGRRYQWLRKTAEWEETCIAHSKGAGFVSSGTGMGNMCGEDLDKAIDSLIAIDNAFVKVTGEPDWYSGAKSRASSIPKDVFNITTLADMSYRLPTYVVPRQEPHKLTISFMGNSGIIGKLHENDAGKLEFKGDAEASALAMFNYLIPHFEDAIASRSSCKDAPVAVVMPEHTMRSVMDAIQKARGFPVLTSNQCHALAESLNYVARLNGVKP